jgi:hypothetical protein
MRIGSCEDWVHVRTGVVRGAGLCEGWVGIGEDWGGVLDWFCVTSGLLDWVCVKTDWGVRLGCVRTAYWTGVVRG